MLSAVLVMVLACFLTVYMCLNVLFLFGVGGRTLLQWENGYRVYGCAQGRLR